MTLKINKSSNLQPTFLKLLRLLNASGYKTVDKLKVELEKAKVSEYITAFMSHITSVFMSLTIPKVIAQKPVPTVQ